MKYIIKRLRQMITLFNGATIEFAYKFIIIRLLFSFKKLAAIFQFTLPIFMKTI